MLEPCPAGPASTYHSYAHNDLLAVIDDLIEIDAVVLKPAEELLDRGEKALMAVMNLGIGLLFKEDNERFDKGRFSERVGWAHERRQVVRPKLLVG